MRSKSDLYAREFRWFSHMYSIDRDAKWKYMCSILKSRSVTKRHCERRRRIVADDKHILYFYLQENANQHQSATVNARSKATIYIYNVTKVETLTIMMAARRTNGGGSGGCWSAATICWVIAGELSLVVDTRKHCARVFWVCLKCQNSLYTKSSSYA